MLLSLFFQVITLRLREGRQLGQGHTVRTDTSTCQAGAVDPSTLAPCRVLPDSRLCSCWESPGQVHCVPGGVPPGQGTSSPDGATGPCREGSQCRVPGLILELDYPDHLLRVLQPDFESHPATASYAVYQPLGLPSPEQNASAWAAVIMPAVCSCIDKGLGLPQEKAGHCWPPLPAPMPLSTILSSLFSACVTPG